MDKTTWIRTAEPIAEIRHEEVTFLVPVELPGSSAQVTKLAGTACFLWEAVSRPGGRTFGELEGEVFEHFDIEDPGTVLDAVGQWVESLSSAGLLSIGAEANGDTPLDAVPSGDADEWEDLPTSATMTMSEWSLMAHALAHGVGSSCGVRVLSIKGAVLEHYELRDPRPVADADIWVEKEDLDKFEEALTSRGWEQRFDRAERQARVIPDHSVGFFHRDWPVGIDVHWCFPGLGVDGSLAFEKLWSEREQMIVANVAVDIPSRLDSAVIQMVHCAREPGSALRRAELKGAVQRVSGWSEEERDRLVERLIEMRACDPLRGVLEEAGIQGLPVQWTPEERRRWEVDAETHLDGSTGAILYELANAPWPKKPRILWNGIWPGDQELIATDIKHRADRSFLIATRMRRWGRGLHAAPGALRALIRTRI